jgi:arylsulfatase A-like enzyme
VDDSGPSIQVLTPNIDRLASQSVMFRRMRAEALPTVPCRRGFFTGRRVFPWPDEPRCKGVYPDFPGWRPLPQEDVTVAEHLSEQGYVTAIVTDSYHLMKPSMNLHRGFQGFHWVRGQEFDLWHTRPLPEGYLDRFLKPGIAPAARRSQVLQQYLRNMLDVKSDGDWPVAQTFQWAIRWLEENRTHERFFLYVETFDPHEPWLVPQRLLDLYDPGWDGPKLIYGNPYGRAQLTDAEHHHLRARYAAACTQVDEWIGRLLDALATYGLLDDTLVILVSDHGKIIGEFGHYGMPAEDMGPALADVPCLIRHPQGQGAGSTFDGWLYNIDVTATMLSLMGVTPKPDVEGRDVWPAVTAGADAFRDALVTAYADVVAAWQEEWLYLWNARTGRAALYNLAQDAHRKTDVAALFPDVREALAARVKELMAGP